MPQVEHKPKVLYPYEVPRGTLLRSDALEDNARQVREFLSWQRDVKRSTPLVVYQYGALLGRYLEALGETPLEAVTPRRMEAWLLRPRRGGREAAAATLARDVAVLKSLYRYLHATGRIERNPTLLLVTPKVRNRQPRAIPDEVWQHVWGSELSGAERVAFGLGFYCGLRRAEVCALRPSHVVSGRIVSFVRKGQGEDSLDYEAAADVCAQRLGHLLPEPSVFLSALEGLAEGRRERSYLLPWGEDVEAWAAPLRSHAVPRGMTAPDQLNKRLRRTLVRVGLAPDAFTFHALRHSFVTNLLRAGVPLQLVSELANHSNPKTTMRYVKQGTSALADWLGNSR